MAVIEGKCLCGSVRFRVEGPERYACFCHCRSCQHASGGAFVPWAVFSKSSFAVTSGTLARYGSSPGVRRGYCADCGTSLTYEHEKRDDDIDITLTSLADPSAIAPRAHIWVQDKLPSVTISDDLPQFPQGAV